MTKRRLSIKRFKLLAHPAYHVRVVVWDTLRELQEHYGRSCDFSGTKTNAFFHPEPYNDCTRVFDKLRVGTIHLCRERWDLELIAHECQHVALALYSATLGGFMVQEIPHSMDEPVCYSVGRLVLDVHKWMWVVDPSPEWEKVGR